MDDESGGEDVFTYAEPRRLVLNRAWALTSDVAHIEDDSLSNRCLLAQIHHQAQSANDEFVAVDDDRRVGG